MRQRYSLDYDYRLQQLCECVCNTREREQEKLHQVGMNERRLRPYQSCNLICSNEAGLRAWLSDKVYLVLSLVIGDLF